MDRRFLTVLGISLVFALVVSSIFYQINARGQGGASARSAPQDLKDVVVATRPLSVGVTVKPGDVKLVKVSTESFPKGAFSKDTDVLDRPVASNILADEPVLEGRLAPRGAGVGLAPIIPPGMRAVTVRVNDVTGVAGFVLPNMRVDVLVTGKPSTSDGATMTQTCLQNIIVLSAGTNLQADARGQAITAPTVTLLADPKQAEILTLANSEGHIQLVLRNGSDQEITKTPGRRVNELFRSGGHSRAIGSLPDKNEDERSDNPAPRTRPRPRPVQTASAPAPAAVPAPPPPTPPDQVVVIRGTTKSVEVVRPGVQQ